MAGGWTKDGAVSEQIEASLFDELARLKAQRRLQGESWTHCADCDEPIPTARQKALPGVKLCLDCATDRDAKPIHRSGINRRRSKDSQLK